jgi:hypothetical protein
MINDPKQPPVTYLNKAQMMNRLQTPPLLGPCGRKPEDTRHIKKMAIYMQLSLSVYSKKVKVKLVIISS